VLREHVAYYRSGRWERTGRTAADWFVELNQYPVVVDDYRGRPVIVAGHHRAAAALLAGRMLTARAIARPDRCAVTPLLTLRPAGPAVDIDDVTSTIDAGRPAHVTSLDEAAHVLGLLGVDETTIRWRISNVRSALDYGEGAIR
jgi:hypothetical protein